MIDAIGGEILSEALSALAMGGTLTTLGYIAGRRATIDVTDLIWKRATMRSFVLLARPAAAWVEAWDTIAPLLQSGGVKPIVAKTFPLAEASDALRYLIEDAHSAGSCWTIWRAQTECALPPNWQQSEQVQLIENDHALSEVTQENSGYRWV